MVIFPHTLAFSANGAIIVVLAGKTNFLGKIMKASELLKSIIGQRPITGDWSEIRISERQYDFLVSLLKKEGIETPQRGMGSSRVSLNSIMGYSAKVDGVEIMVDRICRLSFRSVSLGEIERFKDHARIFRQDQEDHPGSHTIEVTHPKSGKKITQLIIDGNVWSGIETSKLSL